MIAYIINVYKKWTDNKPLRVRLPLFFGWYILVRIWWRSRSVLLEISLNKDSLSEDWDVWPAIFACGISRRWRWRWQLDWWEFGPFYVIWAARA
jgi:hypothetical protein